MFTKFAIAAAYQEYLLRLAREEADSGCQRLRAFRGELPMYFADVTDGWSSDDRYMLMSARIKARLSHDTEAPQLALLPREKELYAGFDWPLERKWRSPGKVGAVHVSAITGLSLEMDAEKLEAARRSEGVFLGHYKLDRGRLRREIAGAMKGEFGTPQKLGTGAWVYWSARGHVSIETVVDFGVRRPAQLRYSQSVWEVGTAGGPVERLMTAPGVCNLLGFPQSEFSYVTEQDVPAAAKLLARLCKEFLDAVPGILKRASAIQQSAVN